MNQHKLSELSIEELKQKEQLTKVVLNIFLGVLFVLIGVLFFMIFRNGITPMIAVPIVLIPVYISSLKNLIAIRIEIKSRKYKDI